MHLRCLAVLVVLAVELVAASDDEPLYRLHVTSFSRNETTGSLRKRGFDVVPLPEGGSFDTEVYASARERDILLSDASLRVVTVEKARPFSAVAEGLMTNDAPPAGYRNPQQIHAALEAAAANYPNIAMLVDVGQYVGIPATVEGRHMYALKISDNVRQDEDEPNVLFVSLHHAREIITPEIALEHIRRLTEGYGVNNEINFAIDTHEIWIAPIWNPDGLAFVWSTNNMWRKNRRPNPGGSFGVDQNRNYDLNWATACGGATVPTEETYRGPSPSSEQETRILEAFSFRRNFAKVVDYHSFGREVLHGVGCAPRMPAPLDTYTRTEAARLANLIGYRTRAPSADGEHQQWQIKAVTTYAFLVETSTAFQPPYSSALDEAARVWPQALAVLSAGIPVTGHVTAAGGGPLAGAHVTIAGITWPEPVVRRTTSSGTYYLFLPGGSYTVSFSHSGYQTLTLPLSVTGSPMVRDVALQPN